MFKFDSMFQINFQLHYCFILWKTNFFCHQCDFPLSSAFSICVLDESLECRHKRAGVDRISLQWMLRAGVDRISLQWMLRAGVDRISLQWMLCWHNHGKCSQIFCLDATSNCLPVFFQLLFAWFAIGFKQIAIFRILSFEHAEHCHHHVQSTTAIIFLGGVSMW